MTLLSRSVAVGLAESVANLQALQQNAATIFHVHLRRLQHGGAERSGSGSGATLSIGGERSELVLAALHEDAQRELAASAALRTAKASVLMDEAARRER